jgi:hypothetical protein
LDKLKTDIVDQLVSRCGPVFGMRLNRVLNCVESPVGLALIDLSDFLMLYNGGAHMFQNYKSHLKIFPPSWGFDVPLATALCKTFLLRMLNDS